MSLPSDRRSHGMGRWRKIDLRRGILQPDDLFDGRCLQRGDSSSSEDSREPSPEEILLGPVED